MNRRRPSPAERRALAHCVAVARSHSTTFTWGARLFPLEARLAVQAIYAVCRVGDDAVDEAGSGDDLAAELMAWWQGIERAYAGTPAPDRPLETALAWVLERHDVPFTAFRELCLGLQSDVERSRVETYEELMRYCRRVGGVVGAMIVPIAVKGRPVDETLREDALALGEAMQLTNILRDVGEDLHRHGRVYLPTEALRHHGVRVDELREGRVTERYVELMRDVMERADRLYAQAWRSIPRLGGRSSLAVGLAALHYRGILGKLQRNGYDNLTRRARLNRAERLVLAPATASRVYGHRLRAMVRPVWSGEGRP